MWIQGGENIRSTKDISSVISYCKNCETATLGIRVIQPYKEMFDQCVTRASNNILPGLRYTAASTTTGVYTG